MLYVPDGKSGTTQPDRELSFTSLFTQPLSSERVTKLLGRRICLENPKYRLLKEYTDKLYVTGKTGVSCVSETEP